MTNGAPLGVSALENLSRPSVPVHVLSASEKLEVIPHVVGAVIVDVMNFIAVWNRTAMRLPHDAMEETSSFLVAIVVSFRAPPPTTAPRD